MPRKRIVSALAAAALCALAMPITLRAQAPAMTGAAPVTRAVAAVHATKIGKDAHGKVEFTKVEGGIRVVAKFEGLAPGEHGFHIHEFGDTSSDDAMSAGGHFNPDKMDHGARDAMPRHVGDLGNIKANEKGEAHLDIVDPTLSFSGPHSILGRGVIVHEKPDDYKQPTGNAGGRVAAGAIGIAAPPKPKTD